MSNNFCILIGGAVTDNRGSIQHEDDFRYSADGVLMSMPAMRDYYRNGRTFPRRESLVRKNASAKRQIYFSGLYLSSWLRRNGFDVSFVNSFEADSNELKGLINNKPFAVVISTSFMNAEDLKSVVAYIRSCDDAVPIVVGGRWVWESKLILEKMGEEPYEDANVTEKYFFSRSQPIDGITTFVVSPAGEQTLIVLLRLIEKQDSRWRTLPNLAYLEHGRFVFTRQAAEITSADALVIDWQNIPPEHTSGVMPIALSLGCPFKCNFCNFSNRSYSRKGELTIRQELREVATHHRFIQSLWFIDDTILLNEAMAETFCKMMIEEDFPFRWRAFIRADAITPRTAELLSAAKCELLLIGMESLDDRVLQLMGKKADSKTMQQAATVLASNAISAEFSFIVGFPGDDNESAKKLATFLETFEGSPSALYFLYLFQFHLFPLSPAFETDFRRRFNLIGNFRNWSHSTMDSQTARRTIREIYGSANNNSFCLNYLDVSLDNVTPALKSVISLREQMAKALLAGRDSTTIEAALEKAVLNL